MPNSWLISPWGFGPLLIAFILTLVNGAYTRASKLSAQPEAAVKGDLPTQTQMTARLKIDRRFFEGPGLTNSGAVSTVLSLLPLLLSEEVRENAAVAALLSAATLLFALSTFFGLWLYSTVATHPIETGTHSTGETKFLIALQGAIVWWLIVGAGCFIAFVLMNPLGSSQPQARGGPHAVIECDAKGCTLKP